MIAECVRRFADKETGAVREVGDRFEVTSERLDAINSAGYGVLAVAVEEEAPKPKRKRSKAKA